MKPNIIKFADKKLLKSFEKLKNNKDKKLIIFLERAFEDIEKNPFTGIQISKNQIPRDYVKKYNIDNCWKYNLPGAWRLIYAVQSDELIIISIILEWFDHKEYCKRFKYK
jgi:Txe/YoeB family toxin of Txe-Axe toxin-antitoxin module